ncbi:hypothetical protein ACIBG8_12970 [Nonomuraea sp. NPDC050556]|uniref:hypothetical protein n=1 Tax=Nonomuraea sp. NPDC050556 TaxID=3364369 RepID=UPI0037883840
MGHGGGLDGVVARAHHYAANGFAAVDAPGHGDRPDLGALVARFTLVLTEQAVPEWRSVLDGLLKLDGIGGGVGYCGLSLLATEPRITAGVLGLFGLFGLAEVAGRVTVPVEFVLQWDDPMVPRERGAGPVRRAGVGGEDAAREPGWARGVPAFEVDSSARVFTRHLIA